MIYCDDGKIIVTNIYTNKMSYLRLPEVLTKLIFKDNTFKIIFDGNNDEYNTLAILGKSVYHMY